ncbi:MAG TPA: CPCC family cysteine-rich protein [Acidothermales bacterium]
MTQDALEGDPWVATSARGARSAKLRADGVLDALPCSACGYPTLDPRGSDHICIVCHWKDDDTTRDQPDRPSVANHGLTLRQAAMHIAQTGVFARPSWEWTAPEYYTADARAARATLIEAYERLLWNPHEVSARKDVRDGRSNLMYAIVHAMR